MANPYQWHSQFCNNILLLINVVLFIVKYMYSIVPMIESLNAAAGVTPKRTLLQLICNALELICNALECSQAIVTWMHVKSIPSVRAWITLHWYRRTKLWKVPNEAGIKQLQTYYCE